MNQHLFVYGSLMSALGHPYGRRLAREALLLGPAAIKARLYCVSWYPAAVKTDAGAERVHGEVYALNAPAASFRWLDAYEGVETSRGRQGEFARVRCTAQMDDGSDLKVWVYLYQGDISDLRRIHSGRWQGR